MLPVVYSPRMVADARSFSPSSIKPRLVVEAWLAAKQPIELVEPQEAPVKSLYAVHSREYVDGVLSLKIPNGFGSISKSVAASVRFTVGGMLTALDCIIANPVVCVPVSGFHHAGFDHGGGFCTLNGLMAAAVAFDGNTAIVDCDYHFADGTEDILKMVPNRVRHFSFGKDFHYPKQANAYLKKLRALWSEGWFSRSELILFNAGADCNVDDPLGGCLNTEQMIERDRIMFEGAKKHCIPIIWCLAGGYQEPVSKVVALHSNTLTECVRVFQ